MDANTTNPAPQNLKFCRYCGKQINISAVLCPNCGCQVEELKHAEQPNIVINNTNTNTNQNTNGAVVVGLRAKNKWLSFFLCLFLGYLGAHKFYEGKIGMGILYILTFGLFGIGWLIDCIALLFKSNPYFVV